MSDLVDLIIVGGGIGGVAAAARAHEAGLSVTVIEKNATVAQGGAFSHSGVLWPVAPAAWFGPGPIATPPSGAPWGRRARERAHDDTLLARMTALESLTRHAKQCLEQATERFALEYEARFGALYLFRSAPALTRALDLAARWRAAGVAHQILTPEACRALETSLDQSDDLSGALLLEGFASGNCALAAKRLKSTLEASGVRFLHARRALKLQVEATRVGVDVRPAAHVAGAFLGVNAKGFEAPSADRWLGASSETRDAVQRLYAKQVVLAAGTDTTRLMASAHLAPLPGMGTPRYVVHRAITGPIIHPERAPQRTIIDTERSVMLVRLESRLRASASRYAASGRGLTRRADQSLTTDVYESADRRLPGVARWQGEPHANVAVVPESGLPAMGLATVGQGAAALDPPRVVATVGTSQCGWGLAFGVADMLVNTLLQAPIPDWAHAFSANAA